MPDVRELTPDDLADAWQLGRLAFGADPQPPPPPRTTGRTAYGAFDPAGNLIGKAADLHDDQWWTGRAVPAADVAGVAVAPEARGTGVARALLRTLLRGAHDRGAAISALFPTTPAPYRACGWEITGQLRTLDLPTATLPRHRTDPALTVRAGTTADLPATAELHRRVAHHRNGLLTRTHPRFTTGELPYDGLTLVEHDGTLVGYAGWNRGRGYGPTAVLTVEDILATTDDAARALAGVLASWHSVTPTLRLTPLPGDAVSARLPLEHAREHERQPWMHRPVDVARAVQTRGWPAHTRGEVTFTLTDDLADWNTGTWQLAVDGGQAHLRRVTTDADLHLTVRGFALLYTATATARTLAETGLLTHTTADPSALDLLAAGPPAQLVDYF
ncbi:GNAT family N-acetyltransferase [Micromonospora sp. WMMD1082]|uniref:GNAT family N-acetyltransferase n=1 Tax=Micromonospora sp. WMMD1082 TaxID=3016104 RepID=UPI002415D678|nr:GNAT family N-acetyltransferase [Micromonospora sp. WMMD1082]MDG4797706.1 GNAT family N-acetyltransferase [Micromonospora sp. WMMD1082]